MSAHRADVFQRQSTEVRSIFGDLPILEAQADFLVYVTADDQEDGDRGNPNSCMFSRACKRAFGSKGVLFYPTIAYVDMLDPADNSRRIVMRFRLPADTRKRLEAFDRGEGGAKESTFLLKAVGKTQTLEAMRKQKKAYKRQVKRGERVVSPEKAARSEKGHVTRRTSALLGVRSGVGRVHTKPRPS